MRRRLLSLCLALAALCLMPASASAACPGENTAPSAATLPAVNAATLCLLNQNRAQAGLPPLGRDRMLEDASVRFSARMVAERFFSHESPDGGDLVGRVRASGYLNGLSNWAVGENIAYGTGSYATAGSIVRSWMNSSGHRANILSSRFRAIGIGIALGNPRSSAGATYTTDFGNVVRSGSSAPAPAPAPPSSPTGSPRPSKPAKPTRGKRRKRAACSRRARGRKRGRRARNRACRKRVQRRSATRRSGKRRSSRRR